MRMGQSGSRATWTLRGSRTCRGRCLPVRSLISPSAIRECFVVLVRSTFDCLPDRDQGYGHDPGMLL